MTKKQAASKQVELRSRIKELRYVDTADITPHPGNWRDHPKNQADALAGVLREVGIADALLCYESERAGGKLTLIDGHLRKDAAPGKWPVLVLDVDDAEADYLLATFDPLTNMAVADKAALDALLSAVASGEAAVQQMLTDVAQAAGLYIEDAGKVEDAGAQVDKAAELQAKWSTASGQLWQLGEHRLICGDCTDKATVDRVMGGARATLAPVDPPYNVSKDYDGKTVDDTKTKEDYEAFSRAWFGLCQSVSNAQIVTPGCNNLSTWARLFDAYHVAPWTKSNSMTNGKVARWWCWEPVFFFGDKWKRSRPNDIFDYPIGQQKEVANHPCPKPLGMWLDLIENYSEPGDVIYEAFSGSGTTIIACEKLGRKCRAVEISPAYVAVALERFAQTTGKTPVLESQER